MATPWNNIRDIGRTWRKNLPGVGTVSEVQQKFDPTTQQWSAPVTTVEPPKAPQMPSRPNIAGMARDAWNVARSAMGYPRPSGASAAPRPAAENLPSDLVQQPAPQVNGAPRQERPLAFTERPPAISASELNKRMMQAGAGRADLRAKMSAETDNSAAELARLQAEKGYNLEAQSAARIKEIQEANKGRETVAGIHSATDLAAIAQRSAAATARIKEMQKNRDAIRANLDARGETPTLSDGTPNPAFAQVNAADLEIAKERAFTAGDQQTYRMLLEKDITQRFTAKLEEWRKQAASAQANGDPPPPLPPELSQPQALAVPPSGAAPNAPMQPPSAQARPTPAPAAPVAPTPVAEPTGTAPISEPKTVESDWSGDGKIDANDAKIQKYAYKIFDLKEKANDVNLPQDQRDELQAQADYLQGKIDNITGLKKNTRGIGK